VQIGDPGDAGGQLRPQRQALTPGAEPDHLGSLAQQVCPAASKVPAGLLAQAYRGGVHQPPASQAERRPASARPPAKTQRRIEQAQRDLQQRQRRIITRHHHRPPLPPERPDQP
jgi:hypothetical protein